MNKTQFFSDSGFFPEQGGCRLLAAGRAAAGCSGLRASRLSASGRDGARRLVANAVEETDKLSPGFVFLGGLWRM